MLKRNIYIYLESWKKQKDHNTLIIYGARQIGKTTSIRKFASSYKRLVEINFVENPEFKQAFVSFNVDDIIRWLSFMNPEFIFDPHNTLIFFDEIQDFMDATIALNFLSLMEI